MEHFEKVAPQALAGNPFRMIGEDWALVTAGGPSRYNTMTVSWGGVGILWNKPVATIYIRPQRHTYGFLEESELFTVSFFPEEYHKALAFCGAHSGRDCDKAKECGITPVPADGSTSFAEANTVLVCRKLYFDEIDPAHFLDSSIDSANYAAKDYHRMYIGEIIAAYIK
jgi:flavin reductase (DIM6/NTAB) family NADH-FMN oxidoreductase RutF